MSINNPNLARHHPIKRRGARTTAPFSSSSPPRFISERPSKIGILGAGLAGLTSAYYLSNRLPSSTQIVVWEKQPRFGGWVQSSKFKDARTGTHFIFEAGPRSVRPKGLAGLIGLKLIRDLKLLDSVIIIPKDHPSAQNRYIYTQDGLQKLPSSLLSLLKSIHRRPVSLIPKAILTDLLNTTSRSRKLIIEDESIQEFISRRFGNQIGDELLSGMVHGIYAGDYSNLSARTSVFKSIWELERKYGGVIRGLRVSNKLKSSASQEEEDLRRDLDDPLLSDLINCSVWGLKGGLEKLIGTLRDWLRAQPNVTLKPAETIQSVELLPNGQSSVTTSSGVYGQIDHLISALPPRVLYSCLSPSLQDRFQALEANPSVTVGVVNLAYRSTRRVNPIPPAFGYLIPKSVGLDINPYRVLGVVFDTDMMPGVEERVAGQELTKLTVMMGGHYYSKQPELIPTNEELISQAVRAIQTQMGIREDPFFAQGLIQKDCIPQYLVGHHRRMCDLHHQLQGLNLSLVGSGYSGVGLNDVIKSSKDNSDHLIEHGAATGLESFVN